MAIADAPEELTASAGQTPALAPAAEPVPAELATAKDDKKRWLIVCGKAPISGDRGAGVIVVESHGDPVVDENGELVEEAERIHSGYAKGADLYIRQSPEVEFPADAKVITIGEDISQTGFAGFAVKPGQVHVGPASAAYAAANLAWQRGATDVRIVGLSDAQKVSIQPYIDSLPGNPAGPADIHITLA